LEYLILFEYYIPACVLIIIIIQFIMIYNIYLIYIGTLCKYELKRGGKIMLRIYDYERILNGNIKEIK